MPDQFEPLRTTVVTELSVTAAVESNHVGICLETADGKAVVFALGPRMAIELAKQVQENVQRLIDREEERLRGLN